MKKFLALAIVVSLTLIMNSVNVAQEAASTSSATNEVGVVQNEAETVAVEGVSGCVPVPYPSHPCPFRPFVRRACTPCVANPCNPCPPSPCVPQPPVCSPVPRKLCGAPIQPPCQAEPFVSQCADPCGYGYAGYRPTPLRNLLTRLFSRFHNNHYGYEYGYGYGCPEFGYGVENPQPCEHNHQ
ncbi:MAG: hypothetical protein LBG58_08115 [Planctomycetaceae bacterium]|jgi:hypothetical protein|nr:hypothetical protein [Planctomycetaceae bacterium]